MDVGIGTDTDIHQHVLVWIGSSKGVTSWAKVLADLLTGVRATAGDARPRS